MIAVRMSIETARFLLSNRIERNKGDAGTLRVEAEERLTNGRVVDIAIMAWSIDPAAGLGE